MKYWLSAPILLFAGTAFAMAILVNQDGLMDLNDGNGPVQVTQGPAGAEFIYRAMVKMNSGDATGVLLKQKLPVGAVFLSVTRPGGVTCSNLPATGTTVPASHEISCSLGAINSGDPYKVVDFHVILPIIGSNWLQLACIGQCDGQ